MAPCLQSWVGAVLVEYFVMPEVSVIVPCFNEEKTITLLLEAVYAQTYRRDEIEIIIADGMSSDATREKITAFQRSHPDMAVRVVDNPKRNIPAGLNRAIEASRGEFIVRLDAHSVPDRNYIARCLAGLRSGKGTNVGGIWQIEPGGEGWAARSIASAAAHPLGVGDARYRVGGAAQAVDTVPFGAFRKTLIEEIGSFNEDLLSNEDYEFNVRLRQAGGVIWMDPCIRTRYFARDNFGALARQYWRYGYWKLKMLLRYPETFRWRQLAGAFVLNWLVVGVLAIGFTWARWLFLGEVMVYSLILIAAGFHVAIRERDLPQMLGVPLAIAIMHFAWGSGFLWSAVESFYIGITSKIQRDGGRAR